MHSEWHTPSFLSLSRAPCRKSKETSSFSSSHCITNCSNHLQGSEDSKLHQEEEHTNPSKPCESCQMSECCCLCMQYKFPNTLAPLHKLTEPVPSLGLVLSWFYPSSCLFSSWYLPFTSPWEPPLTLLHLKALCNFFPFHPHAREHKEDLHTHRHLSCCSLECTK